MGEGRLTIQRDPHFFALKVRPAQLVKAMHRSRRDWRSALDDAAMQTSLAYAREVMFDPAMLYTMLLAVRCWRSPSRAMLTDKLPRSEIADKITVRN